jgi:FlgD Ig-like domain
VEQLHHGRHAASPPRRSRRVAERPSIQRKALPRYRFALALATAAVLVAAAFIGYSHRQTATLSASPSTVPLMGSSVLSQASLSQATSDFGRMPIVRVYYPGLPNPNAWSTGLAAANDSAVIVSFKALPTAILSGADDAALSHFFDTAPTGHPIYYSYYHEPEDNIAAGQFTLADYKAAWARVVSLADAAHNPDLHSTLILMEWDLQKASGRDWKSYLPGGGIISTLGWDAYPVGSATNVHPQPTPPADFMGPAIAASKSVGLPFGFAEFGLSTASGRPGWLTEVGNYLMSSGALFASLFNGNQQYPTLQLTDQPSIAIWRGFVARSRDGVPNAAPSPSPSPSGGAPPSAIRVTGMTVSPGAIGSGAGDHVTIGFTLTQASDVTICILGKDGSVLRQLARPDKAAGLVHVPYYGELGGGKRLPAGQYPVLVVASNSSGSATAEATLTVGG